MEDVVTGEGIPSIGTLSRFRGKRIFLTGDTGFKGSWLALWLTELGAQVSGYALPPDGPNSHFEILGLSKIIHHVDGDIRDFNGLYAAMAKAKPEFVFHLAAQALVRRSYADPMTTFSTNVLGSVHVLEAVRHVDSVQSLVYVTSDKCYWNKEWSWSYRETDELGGHDPYSGSKAAAENVFRAYYHSYLSQQPGLGSATVRAGNVVGGGDTSPDRLVPDCIRALSKGEPIVLRNPAATRPWQFVLEPLGGYLLLALKLRKAPARFAGSWNFGPRSNVTRTVDEIAKRIVERWGGGDIRYDIPTGHTQREATLLQLSIDKVCHEIGWRPVYNVEECIDETVSWYRRVHEGGSVGDLSRLQIKAFMEAAARRAGSG